MNTKRNFPGLFEAKLISLHEFHKELPNCGFPDLVVLIESDRTIEMLLPGRENRSSSFPLVIGGKMENKEEQRCIVLCDDLTGTSVQSIQLKARGFSPILKEPLKKLPEYALGLVKYSCSDNRLHGHCINPFPAELSLS